MQSPADRSPLPVYISNLSEDVWPFICAYTDDAARRAEIEDNINTCDRDLFALAALPEFIHILPKAVTPAFLEYYQSLCGPKEMQCLTPQQHSGSICDDVLSDPKLYRALLQAGRERGLRVFSYCYSRQFQALADRLCEDGVAVQTPEAPLADSRWTVDFFGSKPGIRQLLSAADGPRARMPAGVISYDVEQAAAIAAKWYHERQGVVIKTNKGHSGAGVLIVRPGELPESYEKARQFLLAALNKDGYWKRFPIVIEDYIDLDVSISGGTPSIEYRIDEQGGVHYLYPCAMRVIPAGIFQGVEVNAQALPGLITQEMIGAGAWIAEQYARAGYRGYFDVDFVVGKGGKLYVGESNVRRTGGTHVYELGLHLLGGGFLDTNYLIANNCFPLPSSRTPRFAELIAVFGDLAYSKERGRGVVITSEHKLDQGQLGFIIIGKSRDDAAAIEEEMLGRLAVSKTPV